MSNLKTAIIYARSATDSPESISRQVRECTQYAASKGMKVAKVFTDNNCSGSFHFKSRTEFKDLMCFISEKCVDALIVSDVDRLTRDVSQHLELRQYLTLHKVTVYPVRQRGGVAETQLLDTILVAVCEFQRNQMSQRVKEGMKAKRRREKQQQDLCK